MVSSAVTVLIRHGRLCCLRSHNRNPLNKLFVGLACLLVVVVVAVVVVAVVVVVVFSTDRF